MAEREPVARRAELLVTAGIRRRALEPAIATALRRIERNLATFGDRFPAPATVKGTYPLIGNEEWTSGFWTGLLWLAYELTGDAKFRRAAVSHLPGYAERLNRSDADLIHDLGFLYQLSCVAAHKLTDDRMARNTALKAAKLLLGRCLPAAGIIQAWGAFDDPAEAGRMVISYMCDLPLLYWASRTTGDPAFKRVADSHARQAAKYLVRPDNSTFHTFFMDPVTGEPLGGKTHQGYSDNSCWARGQAWGIAGFAMAYRSNREPGLLDTAARLANYFLNRLPGDFVCCWDLSYVHPGALRDSSAAAIAACGFLELAEQVPASDPDREVYAAAASIVLTSLATSYACRTDDPGDGLLHHAVYHMPQQKGVDESCIFGDYFYLEGLMRLARHQDAFW